MSVQTETKPWRWQVKPDESLIGILHITSKHGKKEVVRTYLVQPIRNKSSDLVGWKLTVADSGDVYSLHYRGDEFHCDCPQYKYRHHCKHDRCLWDALVEAGLGEVR